MTLLQLEYFRVLAKEQHYTRASEILLISQPSLSYAISQLEKELNVHLFKKTGKKISLSYYGEFFLSYVEKSLDLLDEGKRMLETLVDPSADKINLGFIYSISSSFIPKMIDTFSKNESNKNIKFNFIQNLNDPLLDNLKNGKIDLVFCAEPDKNLNYKPILKQPLNLIVPKNHPLANKKDISIEDIKNEPLVLLTKNSALRQLCDKIFINSKIKPNVVFEAEECNAVISFVSLNFGIAIIPDMPVMNDNVSVVKINDADFERTIYMCWRKNKNQTPSVKKIIDFINSNYYIK